MDSVAVQINEEASEPPVVYAIADVIRSHTDFIIAGHVRPDGDCLGAGLGLMEVLRNMGKRVRFYTSGPVMDWFGYLPNFKDIETRIPTEPVEVTIFVDSGGIDRVHEDYKPTGIIVNIDHHLNNAQFGDHNWVDVEATAVGEQIYRLMVVLDQPVTPRIATCLYTSLLTDTGGFRFSNTDTMTFHVASRLVLSGADPAEIAQAVYESRKPASVRLTGEVYMNLHYEFDGRFVWGEITWPMYEAEGGDDVEPDGLASDLRGIEGVEMSALFHETEERFCRVGFRSRGALNVSELAVTLGGGGHRCASGTYIRKDYETAKQHCLDTIREFVRKNL
jgi:bifunctional oligoribonuclease and PAP phosphatase NrnA